MERYQLRVRETGLPNAYGQSHVDGAATGVQVAGAIAGVGDELRRFAEVRKRQQQEWDAATVMNAQNEFERRMSEWGDDPENGVYNVRKLGAAKGLSDEAFAHADKVAAEIAARLENDEQRAVFANMTDRAKLPHWKRASEFEAREVKGYRDQIFKTSLENSLTSVLRDPRDDFAFNSAAASDEAAIRAHFYGADPGVVSAAVAERRSELEAARIAAVAIEDPRGADALRQASPHLLPQHANKLQAGLKAELERLDREEERERIHADVNALWDRFGPDEKSAWEAIEADPETDAAVKGQLWSQYKARLSDRERWKAQRDQDYISGWRDKIADSKSLEEAMGYVEASGASGHERKQLEGYAMQLHRPEAFKENIVDWAQAFDEVTTGKIRDVPTLLTRWGGRLAEGSLKSLIRMFYGDDKDGSGKGPDYIGYSFATAIKDTMNKLGIKEGTQDSAMFVTIVGEEIDHREKQLKRKLSPLEKTKVLEDMSKQRVLGDGAKTYKYLERIAAKHGYRDVPGIGLAKKNPDGSVVKLNPSKVYELGALPSSDDDLPPIEDPGPRDGRDGREENKEPEGLEKPEEKAPPLTESPVPPPADGHMQGVDPRVVDPRVEDPRVADPEPPTKSPAPESEPPKQPEAPAPQADAGAEKADKTEKTGKKPPQRKKFMADGTPYDLEGVTDIDKRRANSGSSLGTSMVKGGRVTGKFDDWRAYRNGKHNGIDVIAPEGTPIKAPETGPLKVVKVVTGAPGKGAGNYVVLAGKTPDGKALEIQVSHMQNGSVSLKPGDVVKPGDVIGRVGNTGMTSDRSRGGKVTAWYPGKTSGHHMDLKVKVNGRYVDPTALS